MLVFKHVPVLNHYILMSMKFFFNTKRQAGHTRDFGCCCRWLRYSIHMISCPIYYSPLYSMHLYFISFFKMFIDLFYTSFQRLISDFFYILVMISSQHWKYEVCINNTSNKELTITLYLIVTDSLFRELFSKTMLLWRSHSLTPSKQVFMHTNDIIIMFHITLINKVKTLITNK